MRVNTPPVASVDSVSCAGPACTFHGRGSHDPDGRIVLYTWDYGDGGVRSGPALVSPTHTYPETSAIYSVVLTVTDEDGGTGADTEP